MKDDGISKSVNQSLYQSLMLHWVPDQTFNLPSQLLLNTAQSQIPVFYSKTKHIDISYHYTREAIVDRQIVLQYCNTDDMIADILTKPLVRSRFEKLCSRLGLSD